MSRVHDLKVWPEFFEPLSNGDKTFEVRRDDRGFSVGDTLRLREWDDGYSDREIVRAVTYILAGPLFGVEPGVVIMALAAPVAGGLLPHPGENHEFRTVCQKCGEDGTLVISLITYDQQVRIEERVAGQPVAEEGG